MEKCLDIKTQGRGPLIMGILNITPDSFSGDGILDSEDYVSVAVKLVDKMLEDGADIIDVGGESSRPGHERISVEEEIRRTVPVIAAIKEKIGNRAIISIDTVKPEVAAAAIKAGAGILNDVSGLKTNPEMYKIVAEYGVYIVLMHNGASNEAVNTKSGIGNEYAGAPYIDVVGDVMSEIRIMMGRAQEAGINFEKIIADPGIGFGKTVKQNLKIVNELSRFKGLKCPIMIGPSRKYFIGQTLNLPVEDRLEGTAAAVAIGVMKGADIVRVHNVREMSFVSRMVYAIKNA